MLFKYTLFVFLYAFVSFIPQNTLFEIKVLKSEFSKHFHTSIDVCIPMTKSNLRVSREIWVFPKVTLKR